MSIKPVAIVDLSYFVMVGEERRTAVRELYQGALVHGENLYAIPDTHRVVSVKDLRSMQWAFEDHRAGFMADKVSAIIEDKP